MPGNGRQQRGFALLLVIWVLAILAVLAAGFAASMRSETRLARNLLEAARARALAEAGVARATAALIDPDPQSQWRADGMPHEMSFEGGVVRIRIEDEGGKVDLNMAPPELLSGLCVELGIDGGTCAALTQGVIARRRAVAPAPAPTRARNPVADQGFGFGMPPPPQRQAAAFATVEELRQLPEVDRASLDRLSPFVTVYAQNPRIDPAVAPREVLLAIPGIDPREVDQLLAARAAAASGQPVMALPGLTGVDAYAARSQMRAATIIAEARTESGAEFTRRAVIALTGLPVHPADVLEWRQDLGAEEPEQR